jgi:hypothetical protein
MLMLVSNNRVTGSSVVQDGDHYLVSEIHGLHRGQETDPPPKSSLLHNKHTEMIIREEKPISERKNNQIREFGATQTDPDRS